MLEEYLQIRRACEWLWAECELWLTCRGIYMNLVCWVNGYQAGFYGNFLDYTCSALLELGDRLQDPQAQIHKSSMARPNPAPKPMPPPTNRSEKTRCNHGPVWGMLMCWAQPSLGLRVSVGLGGQGATSQPPTWLEISCLFLNLQGPPLPEKVQRPPSEKERDSRISRCAQSLKIPKESPKKISIPPQ